MKICITDSGLGGLSVLDELVERLSKDGLAADICYFNASYSHELGYNYLGGRQAQLEMFDRVLSGIERYCAPDLIVVACNTLSILVEHTQFAHCASIPVIGIIESGVALMKDSVNVNGAITIFGTRTTIDSGVYRQALINAQWQPQNIAGIACHGLPMAISCNDNVQLRIKQATEQALPESYYLLACTHFGVAAKYFGSDRILNPNSRLVDDIYHHFNACGGVELQMVARYQMDITELSNWGNLVKMPSVAQMLADYDCSSELF